MSMKRKMLQNKVVSLITKCAICDKQITKKNYKDGIYLCNNCYKLNDVDINTKLFDKIMEIQKENKNLDKIIDEIYKLYKGE
ncbi:MAG: hypothetical protein ACOCP8_00735 [archaeon]